jgi:glutamine synthetase
MIVEYIWIDGFGTTRSKTRVIQNGSIDTIPTWNYDGSSTGQAMTEQSEVILRPVAHYPSPFSHLDYLVLCDTWLPSGDPHPSNQRVHYKEVEGSRFGFEQEFFLTDKSGTLVPSSAPQGGYYCGVGANHAIERTCILEAMTHCIKAGLKITGMNAEVAPAQWELQIDDMGIQACDGLWMLRYILTRTVESYGFGIELHPKPLGPEWNGSGGHTNYSTPDMRAPGGYSVILKMIQELGKNHGEDIEFYGEDNRMRLSGKCETSSYDRFSYGVADRSASIRIPTETHQQQCGYLEDRRPASNMDPYRIASILNMRYRNIT